MRITAEQVRRLQFPHKEFLDELNRIYESIKFVALLNPVEDTRYMSFYYYLSDNNCPEKEVLYRIKSALEMDGYKVKLAETRDYYRLCINWAE